MTSSSAIKSQCAICGKQTGIFTCRGCTKDFCTRHVIEHRQTLEKQLDEVFLEHDQLRQQFIESTNNPRQHPLMIKIDEWEQTSIAKIRQWANDVRQEFENTIRSITKVPSDLERLSEELVKARENDDYAEIDLKIWLEKLQQVKQEFIDAVILEPLEDNNEKSFISKIAVIQKGSVDVFQESKGATQIDDNGRVIVHVANSCHGSARCKRRYSSGLHKINFVFEQSSSAIWAFFGIVSKNSGMKEASWNTPSVYGWTTNWHVSRNGVQNTNPVATRQNIKINDIFELFIDCDRRTIRLTHKRTSITHQIGVDITSCPFPWQILLGLNTSAGDCIRLL